MIESHSAWSDSIVPVDHIRCKNSSEGSRALLKPLKPCIAQEYSVVFKEVDVTTRAARPETGHSISTRSSLHQTGHDEDKNLVSPI